MDARKKGLARFAKPFYFRKTNSYERSDGFVHFLEVASLSRGV